MTTIPSLPQTYSAKASCTDEYKSVKGTPTVHQQRSTFSFTIFHSSGDPPPNLGQKSDVYFDTNPEEPRIFAKVDEHKWLAWQFFTQQPWYVHQIDNPLVPQTRLWARRSGVTWATQHVIYQDKSKSDSSGLPGSIAEAIKSTLDVTPPVKRKREEEMGEAIVRQNTSVQFHQGTSSDSTEIHKRSRLINDPSESRNDSGEDSSQRPPDHTPPVPSSSVDSAFPNDTLPLDQSSTEDRGLQSESHSRVPAPSLGPISPLQHPMSPLPPPEIDLPGEPSSETLRIHIPTSTDPDRCSPTMDLSPLTPLDDDKYIETPNAPLFQTLRQRPDSLIDSRRRAVEFPPQASFIRWSSGISTVLPWTEDNGDFSVGFS